MSTVDPRTPVIVGAGQFLQRPQEPTGALEPVEMMAEAVRRAAHDTGVAGLAERADAIRVVKGAWPYHDPGRIVAERLGASPRQTALSTDGGNTPQSLVNRSCLEIQAGRLDVVVLVGGEGIWSRRRGPSRRQDHPLHRRQRLAGGGGAGPRAEDELEVGDGAGLRGADQHLPDLRERHPGTAGRVDPRAPHPHLRTVGALQPGRGGQPPYAWVRRPMT